MPLLWLLLQQCVTLTTNLCRHLTEYLLASSLLVSDGKHQFPSHVMMLNDRIRDGFHCDVNGSDGLSLSLLLASS